MLREGFKNSKDVIRIEPAISSYPRMMEQVAGLSLYELPIVRCKKGKTYGNQKT
jgi:hypothetical protein